ncbi:MAG: translation initiation factor IF-2 [Candidatus Pacebacteria bacterium]|nr:translation initiation factor IF-2 [Candidatus Paceibacterota bacterium]
MVETRRKIGYYANMVNEIENKKVKQPVVVVMGHVDHGKSSLLEAIKEDFVITAKESGGITQHIGAYEVIVPSEKAQSSRASQPVGEGLHDFSSIGTKITFIDTPGHEAFSAMRQRGARVADIAILVIDAAEGIKPQTKEAINFIKKAEIPMVVAFNKMDKPGADAEKVKQELSREDILVESWGGKVLSVKVSAKTKQGINELLETILLVGEMEDLKADLKSQPEAIVIESSLDAKRGAVATLILEKGILKAGDILGTNSAFGKVKKLLSFQGKEIEQVFPGQVARILGFEMPPVVGEKAVSYDNLEKAKNALKPEEPEKIIIVPPEEGSEKIFLNLIIKADVHGSLEAIESVLAGIPQDKVGLKVLHMGVGEINVSDIKEAESSDAVIFGFRLKIGEEIKRFAIQRKVKIKNFEVIYEMVQDVRAEMLAVLAPETERVDLAKLKIIAYFKKSKDTQIIGGKVLEGEFTKNTMVEVFRADEMIGKGRIKSLEREKQEVGKAVKGQEVGMMFVGDVKIEIDDVLQVFREERSKGTL